MKAAPKGISQGIPPEIAIAVGEAAIRIGQLERIIMAAAARVTRLPEQEFLEVIGSYKGDTLGNLIKRASNAFGKSYAWFDVSALKAVNRKRQCIHDALMVESDGTLVWQANSDDRLHRHIDLGELHSIRDEALRLIVQVGEGSLNDRLAA